MGNTDLGMGGEKEEAGEEKNEGRRTGKNETRLKKEGSGRVAGQVLGKEGRSLSKQEEARRDDEEINRGKERLFWKEKAKDSIPNSHFGKRYQLFPTQKPTITSKPFFSFAGLYFSLLQLHILTHLLHTISNGK